MNTYDAVVIGAGPGGYVAAIRLAQKGIKTALIERYNSLGGTCLNVGCIPSKALLDSSEHFYQARHQFEKHGIRAKGLEVDFGQMIERKNEVVAQTVEGIRFLMKKNKIDVLHGHATFQSPNSLIVKHADDKVTGVQMKHAIIATGSKPGTLNGVAADGKRIITSTEALSLKEIPRQLLVIGGGAIGLELGSVYARLGSKVSVIEYADSIIPSMDRGLGRELQKILQKQGLTFHLQHAVQAAAVKGRQVTLKVSSRTTGENTELSGDYCLVSVGRVPYTYGLGLENIGINTDERGRIPVNDSLETTVPGIYAIGDVIKGPMLAHKAEEEGVFVAERIAGEKPHINYLLIPGVVYTWPEVAGVGYTEEELKKNGKAYKSGSFPFKASGRARASMDTDGFIKVLADKESDEIIGVHMIGPRAADLIAEAVVAMEFRASAEDIARMSHAHPTYSESFREACLGATDNRAIHT